MIEKAARGPVRDLLEGQEQRGKKRLHEPRERKISPSHHHHIFGNADVALAQRAVQAEGVIIVADDEGVWPPDVIQQVGSDAIGIVGMTRLGTAKRPEWK